MYMEDKIEKIQDELDKIASEGEAVSEFPEKTQEQYNEERLNALVEEGKNGAV